MAPASPGPHHWVRSPHSAAARQDETDGGDASPGLCCVFSFEDASPAALPVAFAMTKEQNPARNAAAPPPFPSQSRFPSHLPEALPSGPGVSALTHLPGGRPSAGRQTLAGRGLVPAGARSPHGRPGALGMSQPRRASVVSRLGRGRAAQSRLWPQRPPQSPHRRDRPRLSLGPDRRPLCLSHLLLSWEMFTSLSVVRAPQCPLWGQGTSGPANGAAGHRGKLVSVSPVTPWPASRGLPLSRGPLTCPLLAVAAGPVPKGEARKLSQTAAW